MSKFNGKVEISKDDYYRLFIRDLKLELMENEGVDNWEGMSEIDYDELDKVKQDLYKRLHNSNSLIYL